jgi:hypothetical protein
MPHGPPGSKFIGNETKRSPAPVSQVIRRSPAMWSPKTLFHRRNKKNCVQSDTQLFIFASSNQPFGRQLILSLWRAVRPWMRSSGDRVLLASPRPRTRWAALRRGGKAAYRPDKRPPVIYPAPACGRGVVSLSHCVPSRAACPVSQIALVLGFQRRRSASESQAAILASHVLIWGAS